MSSDSSTLNDKRRERYLGALDLVVGLLEQESMPADAAVVHAVSEVKGMFTQCRMKNQRAWYRVWQAFGEPSRDEAARWSRNLDELRKSLGDDAAFATLASDLLQEDLPETLRRAARSIRDEGRAIAAGPERSTIERRWPGRPVRRLNATAVRYRRRHSTSCGRPTLATKR